MHVSRILPALIITLILALAVEPATAQRDNSRARPSPNAAVSQTIGTTQIDLHYGRPAVKERALFGGLVPWDKPWRAGANEPTTVTFSDDVNVGGKSLEAGTYNLFVRPSEEGPWSVIFTTPVRWGTMFDQATPVLEVTASPEVGPHQEWLSYGFEDLSDTSANLVLHWGTTTLPIAISTP